MKIRIIKYAQCVWRYQWKKGHGRKEIKVIVYCCWTLYPKLNRTQKPLGIAFSGVGRGLRGRDDGCKVNNVQ
jgi:hypothetical protein